MSKSIREKKEYLYRKWSYLRDITKDKNIPTKRNFELYKAQDETYKKYLFYKGYLNAKEGVENEKSKKIK